MDSKDTFTFVGYDKNFREGNIAFHYELEHRGQVRHFRETIAFTPPDPTHTDAHTTVIDRILDNLLLALGLSYWKLYCPARVLIKPFPLGETQAHFWNTVYTKGLGEFYYKNHLDFRDLVHFPWTSGAGSSPAGLAVSDRALVLLGGGKDSIVSAELLKQQKIEFTLFTLNTHPIQESVAEKIGRPIISFRRTIDPLLLELNKEGDAYNGHIPITSIYSWTAVLAGALYGYRFVIASNEKSANYGNVSYLGSQINHQWSKSWEYEQMFARYLQEFVTGDMAAFSLLRPLHEIQVVERFSRYPKYFDSFSSCNANFRIENAARSRWCGQCPKCAFLFLLLAAYVSKPEVVRIFSKNLFEDEAILPIFRELLGLAGFKPFECVGTPEESLCALWMIDKKGQFSGDPVFRQLVGELPFDQKRMDEIQASVLVPSHEHGIPGEFSWKEAGV